MASTPLAQRDFKTVCNGGIVAGRDRVLVVEAFAGRPGAQWVADAALELTGRRPTDVVVTHYHGDHTGGLTGFMRDGEAPRLHGTQATLHRLVEPARAGENQETRERRAMIEGAEILDEGSAREIDLGGRRVILLPWRGHTASDVTVDLPDHEIAFGGDLLWNRMIPNFVDAAPLELVATLQGLRDRGARRWVPGHGALGEPRVVELNLELCSFLDDLARRSLDAGKTPAAAAAETPLPAPFDAWVAFSPNYVERALAAWQRDLSRPPSG